MAIIKTHAGPYTLEALNDEVVFGSGYINLDLDDTDALLFTIVAPTSTLDFQCQASIDGTNWSPYSMSRGQGFGATIQLAGAALTDWVRVSHGNIPYIKLKIVAYTSGSVTVSSFKTFRQLTR